MFSGHPFAKAAPERTVQVRPPSIIPSPEIKLGLIVPCMLAQGGVRQFVSLLKLNRMWVTHSYDYVYECGFSLKSPNRAKMRTIQMTLDDDLVDAVDLVSAELQTSRSAFTRQALRDALAKYQRQQKEVRHRQGYKSQPRVSEEFGDWETEQVWGEE